MPENNQPQPEPKLPVISPANASLEANAAQQFKLEPEASNVQWSIKPDFGKIDQDGFYTTPEKVTGSKTVLVIAKTAENHPPVTATVQVTDAPERIRFIAKYGIVIAICLGAGIVYTWGNLRPKITSRPELLIVNPQMVTLNASQDNVFQFAVTSTLDAKSTVNWSVEEGGGEIDSSSGLYKHKKDPDLKFDKLIKLSARSSETSSRLGTAVVHLLAGKHLEIQPQVTTMLSSQQVTFRAPNATSMWSLSRSDLGSISKDGVFTAGSVQHGMDVLQLNAWGASGEHAALTVAITPAAGTVSPSSPNMLIFVILCGSLGSMVYFTSSFVNYVGNRTFGSTWFWFYISRPFVGGGMGIIFYFVLCSGKLIGVSADDPMTVGMVSALVGLFSDKAVIKLSDIMNVLLAASDTRKDKMDEGATKPQAPKASAAPPTNADKDNKKPH